MSTVEAGATRPAGECLALAIAQYHRHWADLGPGLEEGDKDTRVGSSLGRRSWISIIRGNLISGTSQDFKCTDFKKR